MDRIEDDRLDRLNAWFFRTRYPPDDRRADRRRRVLVDAAVRTALRALVGERFMPRLAAYPGPTLILNGEFDLAFRLSAPDLRGGRAVDARRVRLAGATHLANLDRPLAFSEAVRRFARSLPATDDR